MSFHSRRLLINSGTEERQKLLRNQGPTGKLRLIGIGRSVEFEADPPQSLVSDGVQRVFHPPTKQPINQPANQLTKSTKSGHQFIKQKENLKSLSLTHQGVQDLANCIAVARLQLAHATWHLSGLRPDFNVFW